MEHLVSNERACLLRCTGENDAIFLRKPFAAQVIGPGKNYAIGQNVPLDVIE